MSKYELTPRAKQGLEEIVTYVLDEFGPHIAAAVLDRHVAAFEKLTRHPGIGHIRQDITDDADVRFWSVGPSLIAYRQQAARVQILFVERGERDWARLLLED